MKRLVLMVLFGVMALQGVLADENNYLIFRQQDNIASALTALGTTITFADGNLVATQGTQTVSVPLADMKDMFFSSNTAVSLPSTPTKAGKQTVYTPSGQFVGTVDSDANLPATLKKGFYVVKQNGETHKIVVR